MRQGHYAACVAAALPAVEAAERGGHRDLLANAYYLLHAAYGDLGSPEVARYRDLALPIYEELGDLVGQGNVLNNLGIEAYFEGRWDDALDLYRRSREAKSRAGDIANAATQSNNEAEVLSDQGRLAEAEALLRDALRVWSAAGYQIGVALATSNLGRVGGAGRAPRRGPRAARGGGRAVREDRRRRLRRRDPGPGRRVPRAGRPRPTRPARSRARRSSASGASRSRACSRPSWSGRWPGRRCSTGVPRGRGHGRGQPPRRHGPWARPTRSRSRWRRLARLPGRPRRTCSARDREEARGHPGRARGASGAARGRPAVASAPRPHAT